MTLGRHLLLEALQTRTRRELAERIGVTPQAVGRWAAGVEVPSRYVDRKALRDVAGIGLDAWEDERTFKFIDLAQSENP